MKLTIKSLGQLFLAVTFLAGCAMPGSAAPTPTIDAGSILTAAVATAAVRLTQVAQSATATPQITPTETPVPSPTVIQLPTSIATIQPIVATVNANSRVRGIPAKSKENDLGGLMKGQSIRVIARNDAATWYYILFADSPTGTAWVIASVIELGSDMALLPVVIYPNGYEGGPLMLPPFIYKVTGTPLPPGQPPAGWTKYGTLLQQANVRIGPSVGFLTIGILQPGDKVSFSGRIAENAWVQIDYPSGPGGKGWILAQLLQANDGFGGLPYFDVLGTPVTPTPDNPAPTPGSTSAPEAAASATPAPVSSGAAAEVTNQINVRSGPAQSYSSYGLLNPKDKVVVTGLTLNKYWYQIEFKTSPSGFGWVASQYVRVTGDMRKLQYFNNEGTPVP
jgi:uncharacterized protein YraI